ncbi:MAG: Crp/Fnr family transcriptional regulator [Deltaproteobacteria bacterium]|nr:Crp/Fnr family transcriptional regulator [Deltaproteobacteria bacterium]
MNQKTLWYLNTNRLLKDLPEEDINELVPLLKESKVDKRECVYNMGDASDTLYILKEGRIKISRFSEDGRELTIDILDPGDVFGELSLAGELERETSAEALEDSFICSIKRDHFESFLSKRPGLSLNITRMIGGRMRKIENRLENLIFQDVQKRLLFALSDLGEKYGTPVDEGTMISVRLSHQEIANLIGAARETVTAELNSLKKSGRIIASGRDIILPS